MYGSAVWQRSIKNAQGESGSDDGPMENVADGFLCGDHFLLRRLRR